VILGQIALGLAGGDEWEVSSMLIQDGQWAILAAALIKLEPTFINPFT